MSAVIVVCVVWFGLVAVLGACGIARAARPAGAPRWRRVRSRAEAGADASIAAIGRVATSTVVLLAAWSVVVIVGCLLGIGAHRLQSSVDLPALHWWQRNQLGGPWAHAWRDLTNIGSTKVIPIMVVLGVVVLSALYYGRRFWWAPPIFLVLAWVAEKYAQTILKDTVHRGHPPTSLGSWPSGGMARVIGVYGLIIYFLILRFAPGSRRTWAAGGTLLALLASVQAYARINNLEHWVTDVVGGFFFGLMLLAMSIAGHRVFVRVRLASQPVERPLAAAVRG